MREKNSDRAAGRRIELAVGRMESLSVLPSVAAILFSQLGVSGGGSGDLAETIESDPVLLSRLFSLVHQCGVSVGQGSYSVRRLLGRLPEDVLRDSFFSLKVYPGFGSEGGRAELRKQLTLHSIAVGCCCQDIAEMVLPGMDKDLAYMSGLFHNIGNFAIDEAMPKSFESLVGESRSAGASLRVVERKYLGIDYRIIGKRLAGRWHLPEDVGLSIWLHGSAVAAGSIPEAKLAQVVNLADMIAVRCGYGLGSKTDDGEQMARIAAVLGLDPGQLEQIGQRLGARVSDRSSKLGLESKDGGAAEYCRIMHGAAAELAKQQSKLSTENRRLLSASSHFGFLTDFLGGIDAGMSAIEAGEDFAVRWQKFYQTGKVCLYLLPGRGSGVVEAAVVENLADSKVVSFDVPLEDAAIPQQISGKFAILDAADHVNWLWDQLEVELNPDQAKLVPLLCGGRAVGAIVFELRYPLDSEVVSDRFKASCSVGGAVLDMLGVSGERQNYAERFVDLLDEAKRLAVEEPLVVSDVVEDEEKEEANVPVDGGQGFDQAVLDALGEMAAGAAHELNNPLSVISGRAQFLMASETKDEKREMLQQIVDNAGELSGIIENLLAFAHPPAPRRGSVSVRQIIDEAVQLSAIGTNGRDIDADVEVADGLADVMVDSAQIASAVANILVNSFESYDDQPGSIRVSAFAGSEGTVMVEVVDQGRGMDAETLAKAAGPFYSVRPAGRKRGMGLAHAVRLIEINGGSFDIASEPGKGTTVTIGLPCD